MTNQHVNYVCSTSVTALQGVSDIDAEATLYDHELEPKKIKLRQLLVSNIRYKEGENAGSTLIAEVHQNGAGSKTEIVVPNSPSAETTVEMMNKNPAAYIYYTLGKQGVDEEFLKEILRRGFDAAFYMEIPHCTLDENGVLTTPKDLEDDARDEDLTAQPWFQDLTGDIGKGGNGKKKVDAAFAFHLDGEHSVKTIHKTNDDKYEKLVGKDTLNLGKKGRSSEVIDVDDDSDDNSVMTTLTNMSKGDLLQWVRKKKAHLDSTGQPPKKSASNKSDQNDLSDDEASSSDSSNSSEESTDSKAASQASDASQMDDDSTDGA
jgi:hypothetical protein